MKRDILCQACFKPHVVDQFDSYRYYKPKRGELTMSCVCDGCNIPLTIGDRVTCRSFAFSEADYFEWESEYIK